MSLLTKEPHWVWIQEPGGADTRDPTTGRWIPAPASLIYEGPADVQDAGAVLSRDTLGQPVLTSDAKMFLPRSAQPMKPIKAKQTVKIDWKTGELSDAEIVQYRRMDKVVFLRFV